MCVCVCVCVCPAIRHCVECVSLVFFFVLFCFRSRTCTRAPCFAPLQTVIQQFKKSKHDKKAAAQFYAALNHTLAQTYACHSTLLRYCPVPAAHHTLRSTSHVLTFAALPSSLCHCTAGLWPLALSPPPPHTHTRTQTHVCRRVERRAQVSHALLSQHLPRRLQAAVH